MTVLHVFTLSYFGLSNSTGDKRKLLLALVVTCFGQRVEVFNVACNRIVDLTFPQIAFVFNRKNRRAHAHFWSSPGRLMESM